MRGYRVRLAKKTIFYLDKFDQKFPAALSKRRYTLVITLLYA